MANHDTRVFNSGYHCGKDGYFETFCGNHPIHMDMKYINPMQLNKDASPSRYQSSVISRPSQSVQVVIPSPNPRNESISTNPLPHTQGFPPVTVPPHLDYQLLLISLADDYIAAAHRAGAIVALHQREVDVLEYQKLVIAGLTCLEASLKVCSFNQYSDSTVSLMVQSTVGCNHFWKPEFVCGMRLFCMRRRPIRTMLRKRSVKG